MVCCHFSVSTWLGTALQNFNLFYRFSVVNRKAPLVIGRCDAVHPRLT